MVGSLFDPSYRLHMERVVNAAAAIDRQLAERRPIKIEGDELGVDVTRRLSALIHKSMGWTNDRYVLDDPLEILMLPHNDGFDAHRIKVGIRRLHPPSESPRPGADDERSQDARRVS